MKDQILKIAKVKDEKSFYKKYPTEEAFMAKHGKALKKAAMGKSMVNKQLHQLTDFGNPPIAQDGGMFNIANAIGNAFTTPGKPATGTTGATPASGGLGDTLQGIFGGDSSAFGKANPAGVFGKGGVGKGAGNFSKGLGAGAGQAGLGILNAAPQILEGIGQMKEQKTAIKKADQMSQLSGVTAQAAESQDISMSNRKYVRPEDALTQPGQLGSPQGTGTNYLAQNGTMIDGLKNYAKINYPESIKKLEEIGKRVDVIGERGSLNPELPMHSDTLYPGNKYKDAFMKTPNIRTEKDESFKKGRPLTNEQKAIVLHHTGYTDTARDNDVSWAMRGVDKLFRTPGAESSHVVIDFNGNRYNYANPNQVAFHAGKSMMNDRDNVNDFGVGVEFQGDTDQTPLTKEQLESFMEYAAPIMKKNKIPIDNVVTHKQIRKNYIDKNPNDKKAAAESKPDVNDKEYSKIIQALKKKGAFQMGGALSGATGMIGGNPTEVQNTYNPGDLYSDLGYEPLNDSNVKQFAHGGNLPTAEFGDYFQNSGQASIGKGVGSAIGSAFFGPLGGKVGGFLGGVAGNLLGGADDANKLANFQTTTKENTDRSAMAAGARSIQSANSSFMRSGGHLAQEYYTPPSERAMQPYENGGYMAMGGDLQLARGKAEPMSYNPFLPDGGETVMFRGPSHADGGMDIQYGQNGVEVEGGEPAVKLQDGGSADDDSLVVFGNMKIDDYAAKEIGDENANGKKYKNYIADLSKIEAKQNKIVNKSTELIELADTNNPFDQLTMNSGRANLIGTDMKLKNIANNKQNAAVVQNAILDTAQERGIDSDALAKGKIKPMKQSDMAKFGTKMETAQKGVELPNGPLDGVIRKSYNANPPLFARMLGAKASSEDPNNYNPELLQKLMYNGIQQNPIVTPFTKENTMTKAFIEGNRSKTPPAKSAASSSSKGKGKGKSDDSVQLRRLDVENMPNIIPASRNLTPSQLVNLPKGFAERAMASAEGLSPIGDSENSKGKFDWKGLAEGAISGLPDFFRPTNQEQLDPNQLMAEQYALGNNQLEPVQAQTYQPMLDQPYDISLQDQINAVDAQANAAIRASGQNPAAQAYIMSQAIDAKTKIQGEQFRANQANKAQTYQGNRAAINDASLKNLGIYDQQYVRQSQAKSNTKAQTIEALKSISSKVAQNKLENRQLGIQENMYGYRFDSQGRAYNTNNLAQFNMSGNPFNRTGNQQGITTDSLGNKLYPIYNKDGSIKGYTAGEAKNGTKIKTRNGSIVKALKSL